MKKILIVITTEFVYYGGLTNVMMNYYKALNKDGLHIDFASTNVVNENDRAYQFIKSNGSNYYCLGSRKRNTFNYLQKLYLLLKKNKYDVIHINGNSATMVLELVVSCLVGIKTRITHGHTTRSSHPIVHRILKKPLNFLSTYKLAVSNSTGKWLFGKDYIVLNNAINVHKFAFDKYKRKKIRDEIGISDALVIGNVGKLYAPKNHVFLLDVFHYIVSKNRNALLLLVGGGELENSLKKKAYELGVDDKVLFLGMRDDVSDIVQAFDVFVFPSTYEGLGLAVIEAQASGLECIVSDRVPIETKVTDNIKYLSLDESPVIWADAILNLNVRNREELSKQAMETIKASGYDINFEASKLETIYRS